MRRKLVRFPAADTGRYPGMFLRIYSRSQCEQKALPEDIKKPRAHFSCPRKKPRLEASTSFLTNTLRLSCFFDNGPVPPRPWRAGAIPASLKAHSDAKTAGKEEKWLDGAEQLPRALPLWGVGEPTKNLTRVVLPRNISGQICWLSWKPANVFRCETMRP